MRCVVIQYPKPWEAGGEEAWQLLTHSVLEDSWRLRAVAYLAHAGLQLCLATPKVWAIPY